MDWSRTKTIFIITFLLLNSFLFYQLLEKRSASQLNVQTKTTIQERLMEMNISVPEELPDEQIEAHHIVGKRTGIPTDHLEEIEEKLIFMQDEQYVGVELEDPYELSEDDYENDIKEFLNDYIAHGEEYRLTSWDSESRQFRLHQLFGEHIIYSSDDDQLVLFINDENEIESYVQSYLKIEEQGEEQELLAPLKAVEVLLNEGILTFSDQVTEIRLGYYSLFSPVGEAEVFAPMYRLEVNEEISYLVNAIDGSIQELSDLSMGEGMES